MSPSTNGTIAPALELRGVTAGYGRTTVLRDVDLTVRRGTIAALLGPNGAGKTTLLRAATGILRPKNGTVRVAGADLTRAAPRDRLRAGLCLIPEGRGVFPNLTVSENLKLQRPPWAAEASLDGVLQAFPTLSVRLGERAGRLSGGQQQMVALARCLLASPSVVLLDEVSMGLAPRVIDDMFAAMRMLAANGTTLLIVEQYVARALELADVVHLLDRGRLTFSGRPDELDQDTVLRGYLGTNGSP
jgi:branched-chain amino acid transport system ATP-binding protein